MFSGGVEISCCTLMALLFVLCTAVVSSQNLVYSQPQEVQYVDRRNPEKSSLQCYVCNSKYDSRCGDPFNPYSIGIINCSDRTAPEHLVYPLNEDQIIEPVVCRKSVQKVEGDLRVIRGCGYIRDDHDDKKCYRRTGTSAIEVLHCACTKSLCNVAHQSQRPSSVVTTAIAIALAITGLRCRLSP